jgi:hypothetical protein
MYIRFVVTEIHPKSEKRVGLLHAARWLSDESRLSEEEEETLHEVFGWLSDNLNKPTRFSTAKPPYIKQERAISWFKDSATEHIRQIRRMAAIVENHGMTVQMLKTKRVGYVVYEDDYQIVAEPFSDVKA